MIPSYKKAFNNKMKYLTNDEPAEDLIIINPDLMRQRRTEKITASGFRTEAQKVLNKYYITDPDVVRVAEYQGYDGFDYDGPKSYLHDLYVFHKDGSFSHWHYEIWFSPGESHEYKFWGRSEAFDHPGCPIALVTF